VSKTVHLNASRPASMNRQFCHLVAAGNILSSVPYGWFILLSFGIFVAADMLASRRWELVLFALHWLWKKVFAASKQWVTSRCPRPGWQSLESSVHENMNCKVKYCLSVAWVWDTVLLRELQPDSIDYWTERRVTATVLMFCRTVLTCDIIQQLSVDTSIHLSI